MLWLKVAIESVECWRLNVKKIVTALIFAAIFCAANTLAQANSKTLDFGFAPFDDISIDTLGYHSVRQLYYDAEFCDPDLPVKFADYQSIRSVWPTREGGATYYRFTIILERYASESEANERWQALQAPDNRSSKHAKMCRIKKSFVWRDTVVSVHTDAALFMDEQVRVLEYFQQQLKVER